MKPTEIDPAHNALMLQIGEQIKELRKKRGISYTEMAEEIGISRNGYNNIELAKSNFQFITLLRILKYHGVSIIQFFESLEHG
jgi:transcriptional regulator with XRE-family HTH domain